MADSEATSNRVADNAVRNDGKNPDPTSPLAFAASDLALLTAGDHGNCYGKNAYKTSFSTIGSLPACR